MNELSETTTPELIPIITEFYKCLFDPNKNFTELNGFTNITDHGLVKFKGLNICRKIDLNYNGVKYELGLFNYIRDNGNTIGIRNGETDSNFIQYVLDKFLQLEDNKIKFTHDGVTTGSAGKTKEACIVEIEKKAPQLIKLEGDKKNIDLGYLESGYKFEDSAFQGLLSNFLEYAILRNNFKTDILEKTNLKEPFYNFLCAIRNKNKEHESIYNFEAKRGKFDKIIRRIEEFFDYSLFEVNADYSDIEALSQKVQKDYEILKNQNKEYIDFNDRTERGIPNSLINSHYLKFINQLNKNKSEMTFKQLVESLKIHFKTEYVEFQILEHKPKQTFVWVTDKKGIIGDRIAHYEVSTRGKKGSEVFVDVHFEGMKTEKEIFFNMIKKLPEKLEWIDWQGSKSIGYSKSYNLREDDIVDNVTAALKYIDENIGDEIRNIIEKMHSTVPFDTNNNSNYMKQSFNQILYGPPGTGKTYNSINKALEIIDDDEVKILDWNDRLEVKRLYDKKVKEGQIVFTTFHQNMSYEDFIEGIKPKKTNEGKVVYEIENGVFKKLCLKASEKKASQTFEDSYSKFVEEVLNEGSIMLETPTQKKKFKVIINSNETAVAIPETEKATKMGVTKEMVRDYVINDLIRDWKPYTTAIGEYIKANYPFKVENSDNANKNFVIIIDEINRGNVSKIFGELITLVEESKREGNSEAITGILPYSKQEFSVPKNVYILGTMNTADRSVEALDTALRRRFDFVEMMPKYELFDTHKSRYSFNGMFAYDILETINKRIEVLLGRDHLIGHSFFILDEKEIIETKVKSAFYKNIIPLLQEYFYGDYNKIGLVLGSGFVTKIKVENHKDLFANDKEFNGNDYVGRETYNYSITEFNDDAIFYNALNILMNKVSIPESNE
ncbi:AAA domain (dynein-related subfamily) [Flavobacterium fryxellicola]|uniref:ATPase dynein-related AAA domain-containing protein n=1 Tax=Flavobacterium fryxellicola TaxID=249352 RepID=A0A167ZKU8_9FLAO|nr:AAA family ATPase [Flavobacterium fryxellicola]OAB30557.1 hypothetical protein FBFR_01805 [Flavobacterium fryxellicola]SHN76988.1 AAA domain (dynein-related subfamily) [Flavobacterium fryxellicola]